MQFSYLTQKKEEYINKYFIKLTLKEVEGGNTGVESPFAAQPSLSFNLSMV